MRRYPIYFAAILSLALCATASAKGTVKDFQNGVNAFKDKNYSLAIESFNKYLSGRSPDSKTTYYLALAHLHSNKRARAKQLFEYIVKNFPNTPEARHSNTALKLWSKSKKDLEIKEETEDTSEKNDEPKIGRYQDKRLIHSDEEYKREFSEIPEKSTLRMNYSNGHYVMDGFVNGEKIKFQYTRKWETKMSLKDLEKLNIAKPERKPDDEKTDKKSNKKYSIWEMSFDITLGKITRKVPVTVMEIHEGLPEIGRAFFEDLSTKYSSGTLVVTKKEKEKSQKGKREEEEDYKQEYASLPDKAEFKFKEGSQGHMHVNARINGYPLQCMFDTGASGYFGMNHLRSAGIKIPNKNPDSYAVGWAGRRVPVWDMNVKIKIGSMERELPIKIAKHWHARPLVGQEFLRDYQYSIDRRGKRVSLWKKTVKTAMSERKFHSFYDVKCKVENDREYVTLTVNGKSISDVLIDTGASMTIVSIPAARAAGIFIPRSARTYMAGGVGGSIPFRQVYVSASLGPVSHRSFPIMIGGFSGCAIGQDFMKGWRFSVDRDKKLLRFFH